MRALASALWVLALAGAFALGRSESAVLRDDAASVESLHAALGRASPIDRSFELGRALSQLSPGNVEEVTREVEAQPARWSEQDYRVLMAAWTRFDDVGAVDWALSRRGSARLAASAAVAETLAFRDPLGARSFVDSIEDPKLADELHDRMILGWARSNSKDDLSDHIAAMLPGIRRQKAAAILALEIMKDGPDALIQWAEATGEDAPESYKAIVFEMAANALALADPALASRWIQNHRGRSYAVRATDVIAQRWAEQDPRAALDWARTLPAGESRNLTVAAAFVGWLEREPKAAEAWVLSASPAVAVDPAVRVLVRRDYLDRPASALDWAHRIGDPGLRQRVLAAVGRSWFARDPDALKAWLPESGLEQQIQDVILHSRRRHAAAADAEVDRALDDRRDADPGPSEAD